jgi:ribonuclease HI
MHQRINGYGRGRLERRSFSSIAKKLAQKDPVLAQAKAKPIQPVSTTPPWTCTLPELREEIEGVQKKGTQTNLERKCITEEYIDTNYPDESWTHAYTDGSATNATSNGGGGVALRLKNGEEVTLAMATGKFSSNFRAEIIALKTAAEMALQYKDQMHMKMVLLTDALSVITALKCHKNTELNELRAILAQLCQNFQKVAIQWIPSHCNIQGNENADRLAKEGGHLPQEDYLVSYEEAKTLIKGHYNAQWKEHHPKYSANDGYYQLSRRDQVILLRLRTGHNKMRHHLFTKFKIGNTGLCHCGLANMTAEHVLQDCPQHADLRRGIWPTPTSFEEKLYGGAETLKRTADFIKESGVPV